MPDGKTPVDPYLIDSLREATNGIDEPGSMEAI
jgi:hypothetical protein